MKAIWKAKTVFNPKLNKKLVQGKEYSGPDSIVLKHIDDGLATQVKVKKKEDK